MLVCFFSSTRNGEIKLYIELRNRRVSVWNGGGQRTAISEVDAAADAVVLSRRHRKRLIAEL